MMTSSAQAFWFAWACAAYSPPACRIAVSGGSVFAAKQAIALIRLGAARNIFFMRLRQLVFVLVIVFGCAIFSLALLRSPDTGSVTLADLADASRTAQPLGQATEAFFERLMQRDSLDIDLIFFGVLAIGAFVLALRAIFSAVRLARGEKLHGGQNRARRDMLVGTAAPRRASAFAATAAAREPRGAAVDFSEPLPVEAFPRRGEHALAHKLGACLSFFWRGLSGKMVFTFAAVVAVFGLLAMAAVYFALDRSLTLHALQRATVLAVNVGDMAPAYLLKQDAAGLREFLRKLAKAPEVAYALAEDRNGNIFAHSFAVLPQEVQDAGSAREAASAKARILSLGRGQVYEVAVPILEGRAGSARVALWKEEVDAAIDATVMPMMKWIAIVIAVGMVLAVVFVWRITRPIIRLVRTARQISEGDLDAPSLGVADLTEFGELSRALERMRSSVKAALIRLHQER